MSRITSRILSFWENNIFMTSGLGMSIGATYASFAATKYHDDVIIPGIIGAGLGFITGSMYPILIPTGLCIYTGSQIGKLSRNDKNSTKNKKYY